MSIDLTIGMPVYNGERYLEATLSNLLDQSYQDYVLIIADNRSSDRTEEICRDFAERDSRIRYIRHAENLGIFRNYDYVFHEARTPYFKWASSNDLYDRDFLSVCIDVLEQRPEIVLAATRTVLFDDDPSRGKPVPALPKLDSPDPVERYLALAFSLELNNVMNGVMRREPAARTSLNGVYMGSDLNMMGELILLGGFVELPNLFFFRRQAPGAHSKATSKRVFYAQEPRNVVRHSTLEYLYRRVLGVMRLPIEMGVKLRLLPYFARQFWWAKSRLAAELWPGSARQ